MVLQHHQPQPKRSSVLWRIDSVIARSAALAASIVLTGCAGGPTFLNASKPHTVVTEYPARRARGARNVQPAIADVAPEPKSEIQHVSYEEPPPRENEKLEFVEMDRTGDGSLRRSKPKAIREEQGARIVAVASLPRVEPITADTAVNSANPGSGNSGESDIILISGISDYSVVDIGKNAPLPAPAASDARADRPLGTTPMEAAKTPKASLKSIRVPPMPPRVESTPSDAEPDQQDPPAALEPGPALGAAAFDVLSKDETPESVAAVEPVVQPEQPMPDVPTPTPPTKLPRISKRAPKSRNGMLPSLNASAPSTDSDGMIFSQLPDATGDVVDSNFIDDPLLMPTAANEIQLVANDLTNRVPAPKSASTGGVNEPGIVPLSGVDDAPVISSEELSSVPTADTTSRQESVAAKVIDSWENGGGEWVAEKADSDEIVLEGGATEEFGSTTNEGVSGDQPGLVDNVSARGGITYYSINNTSSVGGVGILETSKQVFDTAFFGHGGVAVQTLGGDTPTSFTVGGSRLATIENGKVVKPFILSAVYDGYYDSRFFGTHDDIYFDQFRVLAGYALTPRIDVGAWGAKGLRSQLGVKAAPIPGSSYIYTRLGDRVAAYAAGTVDQRGTLVIGSVGWENGPGNMFAEIDMFTPISERASVFAGVGYSDAGAYDAIVGLELTLNRRSARTMTLKEKRIAHAYSVEAHNKAVASFKAEHSVEPCKVVDPCDPYADPCADPCANACDVVCCDPCETVCCDACCDELCCCCTETRYRGGWAYGNYRGALRVILPSRMRRTFTDPSWRYAGPGVTPGVFAGPGTNTITPVVPPVLVDPNSNPPIEDGGVDIPHDPITGDPHDPGGHCDNCHTMWDVYQPRPGRLTEWIAGHPGQSPP